MLIKGLAEGYKGQYDRPISITASNEIYGIIGHLFMLRILAENEIAVNKHKMIHGFFFKDAIISLFEGWEDRVKDGNWTYTLDEIAKKFRFNQTAIRKAQIAQDKLDQFIKDDRTGSIEL